MALNNPTLILEDLRPATYDDPGVYTKLLYLEDLFNGGGAVTFQSLTVTGNASLGSATTATHTMSGTFIITPPNTAGVSLRRGSSGAGSQSGTLLEMESNSDVWLFLKGPSGNENAIYFSNPNQVADGGIVYNNSTLTRGLAFRTGGNGTRLTISSAGDVAIGLGSATPTAINSGSSLFPSAAPRMEVQTGTSAGAYNELVVLRHNGVDATTVTRRLGLLFKLSSESSSGESAKSGGIMLESASTFGNSPDLHLVTADTKRVTILNNGLVSVLAGMQVTGNLTVVSGSTVTVGSATSFINGNTTSMDGPFSLSHQPRFTNELVVTPASNQNDYAPTGIASCAVIVFGAATGAINITGISNSANGRLLYLWNDSANSVTLTNEDALSTLVNRLHLRGGANMVLTTKTGVMLYYSPSIQRWISLSDTL